MERDEGDREGMLEKARAFLATADSVNDLAALTTPIGPLSTGGS